MSLLSQLASSVFGGSSSEGQPGQQSLVAGVMGLINDPKVGGLSGLVQKFQSGGLGHLVQGWISTGPNPPVTADQLQKVLGSEQIAAVAQKMGLSTSEATARLSTLLPEVVDTLTPSGTIPADIADR